MGRTHLAGALAIAKNQLRDAMKAPFLGLCSVGRGGNVVVRQRSIEDLEPRESRYDEARGVWFFELDLHDDDLPNASFDPLMKFLEAVPTVPGAAFVAARDDWQDEASWFALVLEGRAVGRRVTEGPIEAPHFVSRAQAMELVARLNWQPANEVLASLKLA